MTIREMIETHPLNEATDEMERCIEACIECSATCTACSDACLGEEHVAALTYCISLNLDCSSICDSTGKLLLRQISHNRALAGAMLVTCAEACRLCAEECERHAGMHEHCRICAEACRGCERACRRLFQTWQGTLS